KSMLLADAQDDGSVRYSMLETLRQYARERLEAGEAEDARRRHARHFAELAERIGVGLTNAKEMSARRRAIQETDNLRAAVMWSLEASDRGDATLALRIIAS